ncbi:MAG: hypothetical protein Q8P32_02425 [Candidatus Komeilibacteria bacterium]|nr:hypothetical protein [Candidatus Komeilibacteria bacterium]
MNAPNPNAPAQPVQNPWLQALIGSWDRIVDVFEGYIGVLFGLPVWAGVGVRNASQRRWVRITAAVFAGLILVLTITALLITVITVWAVIDNVSDGNGVGATSWIWLIRAAILNLLAFALLGFVGQPLILAYLGIKLTKNLTFDAPLQFTKNALKYLAEGLGVGFDSVMGLIKAIGVILPWDISKEATVLERPKFHEPETAPVLEEAEATWKEITDLVKQWAKGIRIYFLFNLVLQTLGVFILLIASGQSNALLAMWTTFIVVCIAWVIAAEKLSFRPAAHLVGWIGGVGLVFLLVADISGGGQWIATWSKQATAISRIEHRYQDQKLALLETFKEATVDSATFCYFAKTLAGGYTVMVDSTTGKPIVRRGFMKQQRVRYLTDSKGSPLTDMVNGDAFAFIVLVGQDKLTDPRTLGAVYYADLKIFGAPNL